MKKCEWILTIPPGLALGAKEKGSFGPLKSIKYYFKGSNSHVILPMRSAGVVPCKQALCHGLVDVVPVRLNTLFNKSWDQSVITDDLL